MTARYLDTLQARDWLVPLLVACCGVLLIASIWEGLAYQFAREREQAIAHARQRNDNLAAAFDGYVTHVIRTAETASRLVAQAYHQRDATTDTETMLRKYLLDQQLFVAVDIADRRGDIVHSSEPGRVGLPISQKEYFGVHASGDAAGLNVSRPDAFNDGGDVTIALTRRLSRADGSFDGVVILHARPSGFTRFYRDAALRDGDVLTLAGLDGTVRVRRSGGELSTGADLSGAAVLRLLNERPTGNHVGPAVLDGIHRHFSYRVLNGYPLVAIAGTAEQDILAPLYDRHQGEVREAQFASALILLLGGGLSVAWLRQALALHRLRESELRHAASVANIPGMAFQLLATPQGESFISVSERAQEVCGVHAERIVEDSAAFFNLLHPAGRDDFRETMAGSLRGMREWNWEGRLLMGPDGEEKWINLRARPRGVGRQGVVWDGVIFNITRSKRHEASLQDARVQLQQLAAHQTAIKDEERKRIAREIHDELGQRLTVLRMDMMLLPKAVEADPAALRAGVTRMRDDIDGILGIVRNIASELRPAVLDLGVVEAIEWLIDEFRGTGMSCRFHNLAGTVLLDEERATGVFRILQESLTNAARHAHAASVTVTLSWTDGGLRLEVQDDGAGFAPQARRPGGSWGLAGMRERAAMLKGELTIDSSPGQGVRLRLTIPCATELEAHT